MVGETCNCKRCGVKCRVTATQKSEAHHLRRNTVPEGMCANCAVSEWLANTYPINMILEESKRGPSILLIPAMQEQFAELILKDSDLTPEEIDWQLVVDNWNLPMKVKCRPTNPHRPGDTMIRSLAKKQVRDESLFQSLTNWIEGETGRPTLNTALSFIPENEDDGGYIC